MHHFKDITGNVQLELTFDAHLFRKDITDVLIFPVYKGKIVMTRHALRGMELPGGKVEKGESAISAAVREMWEETGGILSGLHLIGQYFFDFDNRSIVKAIYFAKVSHFEPLPEGYETSGYALVSFDENVTKPGYSPYVQDEVYPYILKYVQYELSAF